MAHAEWLGIPNLHKTEMMNIASFCSCNFLVYRSNRIKLNVHLLKNTNKWLERLHSTQLILDYTAMPI